MEIGDTITIQPRILTGSVYLLLSRDMLEFMGFTSEEVHGAQDDGLPLVVKFEDGKWGKYIGIGKKGKH